MHGNTIPVLNNRLALNKRQEIIESVYRNIVSMLVYTFLGEFFVLICYLCYFRSLNVNTVRVVTDTLEYPQETKTIWDGMHADTSSQMYVDTHDGETHNSR